MAILVDQKTRVLIQGITGHEGSRACEEMLSYGTRVLAGVTPGKGGQRVANVPVYDSVAQALSRHPEINTSLITIPAPFVKDAAMEAMSAGIALVNILTEHVTVQDSAYIVSFARYKGALVVGPSSVGIIAPGRVKIGSVGSGSVAEVFRRGPVGLISKSGGMTAEIASLLTREGLGQSTAVGIGGDQIIGSDFADLLRLFLHDQETRAVVLFGEVGGTYEEQAAEYIGKSGFQKPVVAVVAGKFTSTLPKETVLGHAGTIVSRGRGGYQSKISAFRRAGILVASTIDEISQILRKKI